MASTGRIVAPSVNGLDAPATGRASKAFAFKMPSTIQLVSSGRTLLVLWVQGEPPGWSITPGRNPIRLWKLRPFKGRSLMDALLSVPPRVALVVYTSGRDSVTVRVC